MKFSAIGLATCYALIASPSFAQMSGRSSSSGTGSNGSVVNGTGGSPGPNTSTALNHGITGNGAVANQPGSNANTPASSGNAVNTPAANKAVNDLGNTNTGILKK